MNKQFEKLVNDVRSAAKERLALEIEAKRINEELERANEEYTFLHHVMLAHLSQEENSPFPERYLHHEMLKEQNRRNGLDE